MSGTDTAWLRRAIFGECRRRGIDSDLRRALQIRVTGKESLKDMGPDDMRRVLRELQGGRRAEGEAARDPAPPPRAVLPAGAHASKLRALWICAYELGVVRDRTDGALAAWLRRQTGLDAARWATPDQCGAAIEAMKRWLERDAGVSWKPYARVGAAPVHRPRARVLEALWRRLHEAGAVRIASTSALHAWVVGFRRSQQTYESLPAAAQDQLIRELGRWLRKVTG